LFIGNDDAGEVNAAFVSRVQQRLEGNIFRRASLGELAATPSSAFAAIG